MYSDALLIHLIYLLLQFCIQKYLLSLIVGCALTLDMVRKYFNADGLAVDPKYHLPSGNLEKENLRKYSWPHATLHYGPGIG